MHLEGLAILNGSSFYSNTLQEWNWLKNYFIQNILQKIFYSGSA